MTTATDISRSDFERTLAAPVDREKPRASTCLLYDGDGSFVIASLTPLLAHLSGPVALLTIELSNAEILPDILIRHLQAAFALSIAEAMIAIHLADGATIREISDRRQSALGTVRTQVKTIMLKLDARRQGDVVRTINALRHHLPIGGEHRRMG